MVSSRKWYPYHCGVKQLEYRMLGQTGLRVSALSFGASPLGGVFGPVDTAECLQAVHKAVDLGINFFDVSPYYGLTRAEEVLGEALLGLRSQVILATKAGRLTEDRFDFSRRGLMRSVEESLRRLRTDYVDILQLHDIEFGTPDEVLGEAYQTLLELKVQGKCRFVGMTGYPLSVLRHALEQCRLDVVLSYCHCNLTNTLLKTWLLPVAAEKGTGMINASVTAMGLLTQKGPPPWHPAPPILRECCRQAAAYCRERGVDIAALSLQFAYRQEGIDTMLVGMSKVRHLESNIAAIEQEPDEEILAAVQRILQPGRDQVWPSGREAEWPAAAYYRG